MSQIQFLVQNNDREHKVCLLFDSKEGGCDDGYVEVSLSVEAVIEIVQIFNEVLNEIRS